ncbi:MAG: LacI family DNA-binding transcriptional regulator [Anaerolineae bacterium]|nr:LacI family DNA-binding transcriptional regulator [Anaerolineae bacterium]
MERKQRVTLEDVAREAGVSTMTVSRVVNNTGRISQSTRQHVQSVIATLGYRPSRAARALVTNKTSMVGVIVPDITNPYFSKIVQGIEDVASERNHSVLLVNTNETPSREEAALNQLDDSTIDGLIACSSRLPTDILISLLERHSAVVVINRSMPNHIASCVLPSHQFGYRSYLAARYLAQHGHTKIGFIYLKRSVGVMSIEEFIARLASDGIPIKREWCTLSLPTWEAGYNIGKQHIAAFPELTAVIGGNDLVALGIMRAAVEAGRRIPEDLAIIGGDDILLASQVTPPITTYHVPTYDIGVMAARLLFKRMEGDTVYREYIYTETLIERGSAP